MMNALETEDKDGHTFEPISPEDCTDLCSMPDCSVSAFIKGKINKYFDTDFDKRPNDYVDGKVTAREMRTLYTKWVADAVQDLYENHKPMILDAFEKTGICIYMNGLDKGKIVVPNFLDEVFRNTPYTAAEIKAMEKGQMQFLELELSQQKQINFCSISVYI